ncbi:MAG: 2-succinyl-5-enolpyruvyl-6-hydroxy-3-cyclohexene-1-carboxylic-acid synthase [Dermatophilaceae bacterium]
MNPSTDCATVLVDELVRLGCRHAVLSPGSRSAPLAYALAEADAAGRLTLHVRVDERSAAFLALGLGKATRTPVPVVTTSGSAPTHLHPAVVEADAGCVPLLVVSADRPAELRGVGANQTTDQLKLYGGAVRWAADLEAPSSPPRPEVWRSTVDRAWSAACGGLGGDAGPVHLNVPFRDPLAPGLDEEAPDDAAALRGRADGGPWTRVVGPRGASAESAAWWSESGRAATSEPLDDVPRTLMVLGDLDAPDASSRAIEIARARGWPVVAEPFGRRGPGVIPHGPLLLASRPDWVSAHAPERILVVGRITLTRSLAAVLRTPGAVVEVVSPRQTWPDPGQRARRVSSWGALAACGRVRVEATRSADDDAWTAAWSAAGDRLRRVMAPLLVWSDDARPDGPALAAELLGALPGGARLFVGSSNVARDVDVARTVDDLEVMANRGLAGIDGATSTASGLALASGVPTYALLGDLTFVHDANGLMIGPGEPRPDLTVVVADDRGGGIFARLEYGQSGRERFFERIFTARPGVDLAALCAAYGVDYAAADSPAALAESVRRRPQGLRVVHVLLDADRQRTAMSRVTQALRG